MKNLFIVFLAVLVAVSATGINGFAQSSDEPILQSGITYRVAQGTELQLDLALPSVGKGPFPAVIFLPGICWGACGGLGSRTQENPRILEAARHGYVGATVDHRPSNLAPFPAQLHDLKAAVRWLRANAGKYRIDPGRIGVAGWSSGGHLALLLGLTSPSDGLEGDAANPEYSSRVEVVVSVGGPADLASCHKLLDGWLDTLVGGSPEQVPEKYRRASPVTYVTGDSPPVLLIHGDQDEYVPFSQAVLLDAKLRDAGVVHTLIVKKGGWHSDYLSDPAVIDFFDKYLKSQ